jgi:hypothetical protein
MDRYIDLLSRLDDAATTGNTLYSEAAEAIRQLSARAKYADELVAWVANQQCETEKMHILQRLGHASNCENCIPCRARLERDQELESK